MMGIADYITLANGLLGAVAVLMLILAVDGLSDPIGGGMNDTFIWAAVLCIILSVIGDVIDGPIARRYSKIRILGGNLDIMSDCLAFCVAPALMIFVMFGRLGSATPFWTILLGIACCWVIATGMLRLARFAHEEGGYVPYFSGLSSPASSMFLMSLALFIWTQPATGIGPGLSSWECDPICFGKGGDRPYLDWLILPFMLFAGGMMIADRKLPKLKKGWPMWTTVTQMSVLLTATLTMLIHISRGGDTTSLNVNRFVSALLLISFLLVMSYIVFGPSVVANDDDAVEFNSEE
ncbi:MAG: CDP-alcohol phosphatidyltransferase family protein [Candidatus Poseidoniaceae archaeon]|nr:CDP-alcohol phosphatidyltransferase family protein [Candidatus Poseidoniaceae archaeon]